MISDESIRQMRDVNEAYNNDRLRERAERRFTLVASDCGWFGVADDGETVATFRQLSDAGEWLENAKRKFIDSNKTVYSDDT